MVKKLGILGFILVVVAAAGMVWAETFTGCNSGSSADGYAGSRPRLCGSSMSPATT